MQKSDAEPEDQPEDIIDEGDEYPSWDEIGEALREQSA